MDTANKNLYMGFDFGSQKVTLYIDLLDLPSKVLLY